jgi:hypothetical protein
MKEFFISYNKADKNWAEWVAWVLEDAGHTTVIQAWDFPAGANFVLEMQQATTNCAHTIAMLSPNYLGSLFTQAEWSAAFAKDPTGKSRKLIPVRVESCELPDYLRTIIYCDLVGLEPEAAKQALINEVRNERRKPQQQPAFPSSKPAVFPGKVEPLPPESETEEALAVKELLDILATSYVTFVAQCRVRDDLVSMMRERLKITEELEYERFFARYYALMNDEERQLHSTIRNYTAGILSQYNRHALEILQQHSELSKQINSLPDLKRHLIIWLSKYEGVFQHTASMCLVYVGVEEGVPFPRGVERELESYLDSLTKSNRKNPPGTENH